MTDERTKLGVLSMNHERRTVPTVTVSTLRKQRGAITIISAILILFLMTVALLYAARNSIFDQRAASNEERNRAAFAIAEGGAAVMTEFLVAETSTVISNTGWLDTTGNPSWDNCATLPTDWADTLGDVDSDGLPDICEFDLDGTQPALGYFIADVGASDPAIQGALDTLTAANPGTAVRVSAALQFVDGGTVIDGTTTNDRQAVFLIYAYGYSDCVDSTILATCRGRASMAVPLATFRALASPPSVPFTSAAFVDPNGGWTVVTNPNAGGVGVPVSMWLNGDAVEGGDSGIDPDPGAGTWQTCEYDEWYETNRIPDLVACPGSADASGVKSPGNHGCGCSAEEVLSGSESGSLVAELDLLIDDAFPPDLFQVYFGVPKTLYSVIRDSSTVLPDCTSLDEDSRGVFWITGECDIQNRQVGHSGNDPNNTARGPVVLITAGGLDLNGGVVYGIVYCSDAENDTSEISMGGNSVVYGAMVVDCLLGSSNGTFDLVYNEEVIGEANGLAGVGAANSGWRDFDIPAYVGL
jgi:hypothetical protein